MQKMLNIQAFCLQCITGVILIITFRPTYKNCLRKKCNEAWFSFNLCL